MKSQTPAFKNVLRIRTAFPLTTSRSLLYSLSEKAQKAPLEATVMLKRSTDVKV